MTARSTLHATRRLLGVDAARAIALIGMIATHVEPRIGPDGGTSVAHLLASGRSSALFALLAGVGISLASGGTRPPHGRPWAAAAAATTARAAVIFVVGLILGAFDSGLAVILCYYGALFLVALPILPLRAPWLIGLGVGWAFVGPVLSQLLRLAVGSPLDTSAVPNVATILTDPGGTVRDLLLTGYYPVLTWTAYLLVGMGIGRLPLRRVAVAGWLTGVGVAVAVLAYAGSAWWLSTGGLGALEAAGAGGHFTTGPIDADVLHVGFFGTTPTTSWAWLGIASPHSGAPPDLLHTLGSAVAVLGAMLLLEHLAGKALWPVAAIGSMTFTLYSLHVILVATVLPVTIDDAFAVHASIAAAIAIPWRLWVGRGPLEAVAAIAARGARRRVLRAAPR